MYTYKELDTIELAKGEIVKEEKETVRHEVEIIYQESWQVGVSVLRRMA